MAASVLSGRIVDKTYLSSIASLGSHLVNLRLGNVSPLLSLVHLVLQLAQLTKTLVGLLLLRKNGNE